MQQLSSVIQALNWPAITAAMHENGYAVIPNLISSVDCDILKLNYHNAEAYRKTVIMERYRFGLGEYKYFNYPLPEIIQQIRQNIYPYLAPVANAWMKALHIEKKFPLLHEELLQQCRDNN